MPQEREPRVGQGRPDGRHRAMRHRGARQTTPEPRELLQGVTDPADTGLLRMNTPIVMRRAAAASLVALALAVLAGCGSDRSDKSSSASPAATTRTYVGTAQGTPAFVAVVVDGTRALA